MTAAKNAIKIADDYCYPSYPLYDNGDLLICLRFTDPELPEDTCRNAQVQLVDAASKTVKWVFSLEQPGDFVTAQTVSYKNMFFIVTKESVIALSKHNGGALWQYNQAQYDSYITVIDGFLYLCNQNELKVLNPENGKVLKSRKYRVSWLDSEVIKHNSRLFVATSGSKIIEIESDALKLKHTYNYPGGWAIACTPNFTTTLMISGSYSSRAICFDLLKNEPLWKVRKEAGISSINLIDEVHGVFFLVEQKHKVHAISIENGKKLWVKNHAVLHDLKNLNDDFVIGIMKDSDAQYFIGVINKQNGVLEKKHYLTGFRFDERFQYSLWRGVKIIVEEDIVVVCYSPNEVFVLSKDYFI